MYILKNKYQYQNVISPKKQENDVENFNQWNLFLNKYFSIEKEIIEIEFKPLLFQNMDTYQKITFS